MWFMYRLYDNPRWFMYHLYDDYPGQVVYVSGQIGLNPSSGQLVDGVVAQARHRKSSQIFSSSFFFFFLLRLKHLVEESVNWGEWVSASS